MAERHEIAVHPERTIPPWIINEYQGNCSDYVPSHLLMRSPAIDKLAQISDARALFIIQSHDFGHDENEPFCSLMFNTKTGEAVLSINSEALDSYIQAKQREQREQGERGFDQLTYQRKYERELAHSIDQGLQEWTMQEIRQNFRGSEKRRKEKAARELLNPILDGYRNLGLQEISVAFSRSTRRSQV